MKAAQQHTPPQPLTIPSRSIGPRRIPPFASPAKGWGVNRLRGLITPTIRLPIPDAFHSEQPASHNSPLPSAPPHYTLPAQS